MLLYNGQGDYTLLECLNIIKSLYNHLLPMAMGANIIYIFSSLSHTVKNIVRFNPAKYNVMEGRNSYVDITLEAHAIPTKPFFVIVTTRDGTAIGECHAVRSLWTNLFHYHCT